MGLFDLFKTPTRRGRGNVITIDSSLGNVLVAGNSKAGANVIIRNYAIDSINKGYGLIIFRDQTTGMTTYPSITSSPRNIYEVDCTENSTTEQIDVFTGLNENDINSEIVKLFDAYNEIDKSKKMTYLNYIALMRNLLKKSGRNVKLNELANYPIEEVEDMNYRYATNPMEQSRNDRFLSGIRTEIGNLESYFYDFSQNVIGYILSGNKTIEKIFLTKPIIEISLDYTGRPDESRIIMTAILEAINRANVATCSKAGISIVVDGAPNEILLDSGLQKTIRNGRVSHVLFTVQDVSNLVEKSNEWIDCADTYFFFKQTSNKNKEFCSEIFGTYEKAKESFTSGRTDPTFWDRMSGRGSSTNQRSKTVTYEKERVYTPEFFSSLPDNQAIYFNKKENYHCPLNVY